MTLTKTDIRSVVKAYKEANAELNKRQSLYAGQRSAIYQLIIDDFKTADNKNKVSRNRKNHTSLKKIPSYCAPIKFTQETSRVPFLWECKMISINSSFINAVGYNADNKVLKILMNGSYLYAYQDVPESAFNAFLNVPSPGRHYNRFARTYAGVRLA